MMAQKVKLKEKVVLIEAREKVNLEEKINEYFCPCPKWTRVICFA